MGPKVVTPPQRPHGGPPALGTGALGCGEISDKQVRGSPDAPRPTARDHFWAQGFVDRASRWIFFYPPPRNLV